MNRILMTGDKGFVGSHIRAALESDKSRPGQEHVEFTCPHFFLRCYADWFCEG